MKAFTILLLILSLQAAHGQIVPSSCAAPPDIVAKYIDDADQLTLRQIYNERLPRLDSVNISRAHSDTILDALIAVYNANIPEADTFTKMYKVHARNYIGLDELYIDADSALPWMQQLKAGNLNTGHRIIDSIILVYGLTIKKYIVWPGDSINTAQFEAQMNYNFLPVANYLRTLPEVDIAFLGGNFLDGPDIQDSIYTDHVELTYTHKWGICIAGCTHRRSCIFKVYHDCSVELVECKGDRLPRLPTAIIDLPKPKTSISPNPFSDRLEISGLQGAYSYAIYNSLGQKLLEGGSADKQLTGLEHLEAGLYYIQIQSAEQLWVQKLLKW